MTERQDMTRLTTVRGAGRAAREHAGRTAPGWAAVILRVAGSGLLIATAAIHLDLYLTGYRTIPTIGWLFLLQVIAAFGLGLAVLVIPSRLVVASRLAAAAGAGFALATLGGYLLSVWTGLFGFKEVRTTAGIVAGVVEVAAFVVLAALALAPAAANTPADSTAAAPARFPAQIPPTATRVAGMTAAGLAVGLYATLWQFVITLLGRLDLGNLAERDDDPFDPVVLGSVRRGATRVPSARCGPDLAVHRREVGKNRPCVGD